MRDCEEQSSRSLGMIMAANSSAEFNKIVLNCSTVSLGQSSKINAKVYKARGTSMTLGPNAKVIVRGTLLFRHLHFVLLWPHSELQIGHYGGFVKGTPQASKTLYKQELLACAEIQFNML